MENLLVLDGRSEYSSHQPSSSRGCRTSRLREYNGEWAAASSVLLLPSTASTNPPAQRRDYGQVLQLGEAFSPAVDCNRLLMTMMMIKQDLWHLVNLTRMFTHYKKLSNSTRTD
ncbi:jg22655 [Pararge aegeria aegeria]|uniref:Jg22655 protein n=1 Tax=Pararge aegeria aegeria TaxID=348720 RepID=A0A8S4R915_9NEOP|nr:jg22655 [Pararge aegeria aegeria]